MTVVALIRFKLRFVVASSLCRVNVFTCALTSERVVVKCMLGDDDTLSSFLLHHRSLGQTKFVLFLFLDIKPSTLLFFLFCISIDVKNQYSSFKLFSSNFKYFCFVFVQQLFFFIYKNFSCNKLIEIYLFVTCEFKQLYTQLSKFIKQFYFCNQLLVTIILLTYQSKPFSFQCRQKKQSADYPVWK